MTRRLAVGDDRRLEPDGMRDRLIPGGTSARVRIAPGYRMGSNSKK